jgi:hypothetical protein
MPSNSMKYLKFTEQGSYDGQRFEDFEVGSWNGTKTLLSMNCMENIVSKKNA